LQKNLRPGIATGHGIANCNHNSLRSTWSSTYCNHGIALQPHSLSSTWQCSVPPSPTDSRFCFTKSRRILPKARSCAVPSSYLCCGVDGVLYTVVPMMFTCVMARVYGDGGRIPGGGVCLCVSFILLMLAI
jgi:hypothetical protein